MLRTLHAEVSKGPQQDGVLHSGVKFCNSLRFCACNDLELFDIFCPGMQFIFHNPEDIFASIPIYSDAEF